jgi:hypothetical protein
MPNRASKPSRELVENEPTKLTAAWLIAVSSGAMAAGVIYVEESGEGRLRA